MARELDRRAARAELQKITAEQGQLGLVNLLPTPHDASRFNLWGDDLNTFLLVSHNIDGTLKATGSLPVGGTAGQVLAKRSNASGDADWFDPGVASDDIPQASAGLGDPGSSSELSRSDHVHPSSASASGLPAHAVFVPPAPSPGQIIVAGTGAPSLAGLSFANNPQSNQAVVGVPFYLTNPLPPSYVGVGLNNLGSNSDVVIDLAIYGSIPGSVQEPKAGPLAFNGTVGAPVIAGSVTTFSGIHFNFTATTVQLSANTIYWGVPYARAGATGPQAVAMVSPLPLLVGSTGMVFSYLFTVGNSVPPDPAQTNTSQLGSSQPSLFIPLLFKVA